MFVEQVLLDGVLSYDVVEGHMNQPESDNESERIRVILHENDGEYEHQWISLTSDQVFYIMNNENKTNTNKKFKKH